MSAVSVSLRGEHDRQGLGGQEVQVAVLLLLASLSGLRAGGTSDAVLGI